MPNNCLTYSLHLVNKTKIKREQDIVFQEFFMWGSGPDSYFEKGRIWTCIMKERSATDPVSTSKFKIPLQANFSYSIY